MKTTFFINILLLLFTSAALAQGHDVGNGGRILDCPGKAPELLDIWEGREIRKFTYQNALAARGSLRELVMSSFDGLKVYSPILYREITGWADALTTDVENFLAMGTRMGKVTVFLDHELKKSQDSRELMKIPDGCSKIQVITQTRKELPEDRDFYVAIPSMLRLDLRQLAFLIAHEAILKHRVPQDELSDNARYINEYLNSDQSIAEGMPGFLWRIRNLYVFSRTDYEYDGEFYKDASIKFDEQNRFSALTARRSLKLGQGDSIINGLNWFTLQINFSLEHGLPVERNFLVGVTLYSSAFAEQWKAAGISLPPIPSKYQNAKIYLDVNFPKDQSIAIDRHNPQAKVEKVPLQIHFDLKAVGNYDASMNALTTVIIDRQSIKLENIEVTK